MRFTLPLLLLSFVVLQKTIRMESLIQPVNNLDDEVVRTNAGRRLRAPLMGRSVSSVSSLDDHDNLDYFKQESDTSSSDADDDILVLNKRRMGVPLLGRRWTPKKQRSPLFG